jgi:deoxyribonuclease IV
MKIKIGPSGLGAVKTSEKVLKEYKKVGFSNSEIAFTHSVYMDKEDAIKVGKIAKDKNLDLSIHAPYFVNLNSAEKPKVHASMQRILKCCEIGHYLGAKSIVFHAGFYGNNYAKQSPEKQAEIREETYQNIKQRIIEMIEKIKEKKWNVELCPETMGKINVFGSVEEISKLVKETECSFCIDFAHILARDKSVDYKRIIKAFPQKKWHCHFSGIEYTEKGERNHINLEKKQWKDLFDNLPKDKDITIVCESPARIEDSIDGLKILNNSEQ